MSLTLGFSTALSGIGVAARGTQVVADNISNAQTEGYGMRVLGQAARVLGSSGSGVMITGVHREVDAVLLADLRAARSDKAGDDIRLAFFNRLETALGTAEDAASLSALVDTLDVSLLRAAADPGSTAVLMRVAEAASDLANKFNTLDKTLRAQRDAVDLAISRDVASLNANLERISDLNKRIQRQTLTGGAPQALKDERQRLVDQVSEIVAVREIAREDGRIMLLGLDGAILLDRTFEPFAFTRTPLPDPDATVESAGLSAVTRADRSFISGSPLLASGRLGALMELRDEAMPMLQKDFDNLALDLVARFMQPDIDPDLPAGAFGMFAMFGAPAIPVDDAGAAGRLILNPLVNPAIGGELWRLRDGLGVSTLLPGTENDNAILDRMHKALRGLHPLPDGDGGKRSVSGHMSETVSNVATRRIDIESRTAANAASFSALNEAFAAKGVDTDAELSKLLILEQAYAANARVLSSIDAMWRKLMEI